MVPQYRLLCPTHADNKKKKTGFRKKDLYKCVTRSDLSGVHLNIV